MEDGFFIISTVVVFSVSEITTTRVVWDIDFLGYFVIVSFANNLQPMYQVTDSDHYDHAKLLLVVVAQLYLTGVDVGSKLWGSDWTSRRTG